MKHPLRKEDGKGVHLLTVSIMMLLQLSAYEAILLNTGNQEVVETLCQRFGGSIADDTDCNAYYNCSRSGNNRYMLCPYPRLFNQITKTCDNFETVSCGGRRETKNYCDYKIYHCTRQCSVGCQWAQFDCEHKPDGVNVDRMRLWTPMYIICYMERFVTQQYCPDDAEGNNQYFSPDLHGCVGLDRIPSSHGGQMPNCTGKVDGFYPNEYGRCDRYTKCAWGQYIESVKCRDGEYYDELLKACTATPKNMCICAQTGC